MSFSLELGWGKNKKNSYTSTRAKQPMALLDCINYHHEFIPAKAAKTKVMFLMAYLQIGFSKLNLVRLSCWICGQNPPLSSVAVRTPLWSIWPCRNKKYLVEIILIRMYKYRKLGKCKRQKTQINN